MGRRHRLALPPAQLHASPRAPLQLGELAWAVQEDADSIKIFDFKFAKAPILDKLKLRETDICFASYLSRKGIAVCPHARKVGHEGPTSDLHVFSAAASALRPTFDNSPYRVSGGGGDITRSKTKKGNKKDGAGAHPEAMETSQ